MSSLRQDLKRYRTQSEALDALGGMPPGPADLKVHAAHLFSKTASWCPKHLTKSDSGLFTYEGPTLAIRQIVVHVTAAMEGQLPPGFADAPPRLLAVMGLTLPHALVEQPHKLSFESKPKLTRTAHTVVDLWESSGMSWLALPGFLLSHFHDPASKEWYPVTPQMEGFHR